MKIPPIPKALIDKLKPLENALKCSTLSPLSLLEMIYQYMVEYNKFVSTFAVCSKSCSAESACCKIPVNVYRVEAEYIYQKTGKKVKNNWIQSDGKSPCPFLDNKNDCSIYEHRPFNCRTFHTLDSPEYCPTETPHAVYGVSTVGYNSDILAYLARIIRAINNGEQKDIRAYFN